MSIACPTFESHVSSLDQVRAERASMNPPVKPSVKPPSTARRIEANRRNARRSTGPRTAEGKARVSRNALKHGLCATYAHLPGEEEATFEIFLGELEQEMRPRTVLQRNLFPQIASLLWRIRRLPEAEAALFVRESGKAAVDDNEKLPASEVLARRFSDDPSNGFMLMGRYERSMQNALLRLLRQFHSLQKTHPTTPYDDGEKPCPPEGSQPAWSEEKARAQLEWFAEQEERATREQEQPPSRLAAAHVPRSCADEDDRGACAAAKPVENAEQTQSNPPQNPDGEAETGKCSTFTDAPVTEQTHREADHPNPAPTLISVPPAANIQPDLVAKNNRALITDY